MPAPTAHPPDIDRVRSRVHTPVRDIRVDGQQFLGAESDTRIGHDGRFATFRVTLWNVTAARETELSRGETVTVRVGWRNGPLDTILTGTIDTVESATASRGGDSRIQLTGRARGGAAVQTRLTDSWQDASLTTIGRDIAGRLGLDVGHLGPGPDADSAVAAPVFDGYWQMRDTRPVSAYLDDLVASATRRTGHQFEWYVDRGTLSLHPKRDLPTDTARLTTADAIREFRPHTGDTTQTTGDAFWLRAFATPAVARAHRLDIGHTTGGKARRQGGQNPNAPSRVDTGPAADAQPYRCARYAFETSTTRGTHACTAVVVPDRARYDPEPDTNAGVGVS